MMLRWMARVLALVLFVFWGSFFVEHAVEWFARPGPWPPPAVIMLSAAHLILLAGLALAWKWELAGSILILASALAFFAPVAGRKFPLFFAATALPAALFLYCWWRTRSA
jgi:hypothetical protein